MLISDWSSDVCSSDLGNQNDLVIAFFAAMRLGAVWVGINKILPEGDKRHILAHSGAKLLLTDSRDRKSGVKGKSVSVRVDLGGRRIIKKKKIIHTSNKCQNKK